MMPSTVLTSSTLHFPNSVQYCFARHCLSGRCCCTGGLSTEAAAGVGGGGAGQEAPVLALLSEVELPLLLKNPEPIFLKNYQGLNRLSP